jgi:hypothetical protein
MFKNLWSGSNHVALIFLNICVLQLNLIAYIVSIYEKKITLEDLWTTHEIIFSVTNDTSAGPLLL